MSKVSELLEVAIWSLLASGNTQFRVYLESRVVLEEIVADLTRSSLGAWDLVGGMYVFSCGAEILICNVQGMGQKVYLWEGIPAFETIAGHDPVLAYDLETGEAR